MADFFKSANNSKKKAIRLLTKTRGFNVRVYFPLSSFSSSMSYKDLSSIEYDLEPDDERKMLIPSLLGGRISNEILGHYEDKEIRLYTEPMIKFPKYSKLLVDRGDSVPESFIINEVEELKDQDFSYMNVYILVPSNKLECSLGKEEVMDGLLGAMMDNEEQDMFPDDSLVSGLEQESIVEVKRIG